MICSSSQHTHLFLVSCLLVFDFRFNRSWFSWIDRIKISLHDFMYIRFVLYTYMLHILDKLSFGMPIHVFGFCVNKTYFPYQIQKHWYIYIFHVYWIISIYYMPQSCFNIMLLYLDEFLTKRFFISKIQVLENTDFGFRQNSKLQK